jgi:hypothetical protein
VIEIGCAQGDLLSALKPTIGVGVDFSFEMIKQASNKHPHLRFIHADAYEIDLDEKFDIIILSDLVNDMWDVQTIFRQINELTGPRTRLIMNFHNRLWNLPLTLAQKLGLAQPLLPQNWLTVEDVINLLGLANFEVIRYWDEILLPLPIPFLSTLFNRYLVKFWPFHIAALTHFVVARPLNQDPRQMDEPIVSVIVPVRNEAGNISDILARTPKMGRDTEIVFVEGHSTDDSFEVIKREIKTGQDRHCKLIRQTDEGKADAVRLGFSHSSGDILMILDADLTVSPETLPRFYDILKSGKGEFINGVRLVYPMEKEAMRFLNLIGNKFFSLVFSWLLHQPIKDTLCGTKALWKADYELIALNRDYFGDFDQFGDFDLLFGATKLNLKIVNLPIRYMERIYGHSNIQRWIHGWLLLRMLLFAARRIKFV